MSAHAVAVMATAIAVQRIRGVEVEPAGDRRVAKFFIQDSVIVMTT